MADGLNAIGNLLGKVDANGALLIAIDADGPSTATRFFGDASATLPAFSITGDTNTGWGASAADTAAVWAGGTTPVFTVSASAVTLGASIALALGDSTSLSQGAANRVDLATGDSLYLVSGGLGVGVTPPAAGMIGLTEQTAPSAPAANAVTLYAVDNGAGKTQLVALFSSGAAQQLAIQP